MGVYEYVEGIKETEIERKRKNKVGI